MSARLPTVQDHAKRIFLLAVLYYLLARFGLSVASLPGKISPVWPPTGLAIAAVFLYGRSIAPGIFIGAFLLNVSGLPIAAAIGIASGNTLEALVAVYLMQHQGLGMRARRPRDVGVMAGVAVTSASVAAIIGVFTLTLAGVVSLGRTPTSFSVWWLGDVMGALIVAPLLLSWADRDGADEYRGTSTEAIALGAAFGFALLVAFIGPNPSAFLVFPVVAWAALRFGSRGTAVVVALVTLIAIERTTAGVGRFVSGDTIADLWLLEAFLGVLAVQGLLLAGLVYERDRIQSELMSTNSLLETRVRERADALQIDRQALEQAQRIAHIGSWEFDLVTEQMAWSDELQRLFGYDVGTAPHGYDAAVSRVHPHDRPVLNELFARARATGASFNIDMRLQLPDGGLRWLRTRCQADLIAGRVVQLNGICQDITESKLTEERLKANEVRTTRIIDAASDAFVTVDRDERITDWNRQAELTFGWKRGEVLGLSMVDVIIPAAHRDAHRKGVSRYFKTGRTKVINTRIVVTAVHRDGHEFPVELAVWVTEDASGEVTFHAFLHDISERQANQAALDTALDEAREASRLKSAFLANMSHEIRTPMNGVMGMVGLLLDTKLTPKQRDYIQTMSTSAASLGAIIDDILDVSKIEAGKLALDAGDFALRPLVNATVAPFLPIAAERGIKLSSSVAAEVPDGLYGDSRRLKQVVSNLLANAVKFTSTGEVKLAVLSSGRALRVEVHDTGIGIPKEACARLFEPFVQADASTTRRFGGTGLGLAICRDLVTLMGGEIGVESNPGSGSLFWFTVPLKRAAKALPAPQVPLPAPETAVDAIRVLVVEDNPVNRKVAVGMLSQLGYRVDVAVDGVAAVEAFGTNKFDAILMDCQMPRMDGYDATRTIRSMETTRRTPIIAMTASAMAADREQCMAAGMDDFLTKPVARDLLAGALRSCIEGKAASRKEKIVTATPSASNKRFDAATLASLRSMDDDGTFLGELVEMFSGDVATDVATLRAAIATGDAKAARGVAHRQKGASGNLGLRALSAAFAAIEAAADTDMTAAAQALDDVDKELVAALKYLARAPQKLKTSR
ncbi:MAG: MASE1 domain-containing protein [Actinobacteria bacterium]|nr:MASE1 domain-containing protein [Actinomycetota bacterium]